MDHYRCRPELSERFGSHSPHQFQGKSILTNPLVPCFGVGVDGVGVIFPFFKHFSHFFMHFPLFFLRISQGHFCCNLLQKWGTDPVQNFPMVFGGNLYGPMTVEVRQKLPPRLVLVHGWLLPVFGGCAKDRGRRRAEKRLSKTVFLESPFLLCPKKVSGVLRAKP